MFPAVFSARGLHKRDEGFPYWVLRDGTQSSPASKRNLYKNMGCERYSQGIGWRMGTDDTSIRGNPESRNHLW